MDYRVAFASEQGPRDRNEDHGLALRASVSGRDLVLLGVCDGMGGTDNGDLAAATVTSTLSGFFGNLPSSFYDESDTLAVEHLLQTAILASHRDACQQLDAVATGLQLKGLGTTLVAGLIYHNRLAIWWLGDSRAYLFTDGRLVRLTTDHSKVEETLHLTEDEALEHAERNQVSRFLRPGASWQPEIQFCDIHEGDVVLLVSDGVSGSCHSWELESFLAYWLAADVTPDILAHQILRFIAPNLRDNATVALALCGTPKPFGTEVATVELPLFVRRFLRPDLAKLLTERPHNTQEWRSRQAPPWRSCSVGSSTRRIVGAEPPPVIVSDARVCLLCGQQLPAETICSEHGLQHLWQGSYLEIVAPTGQVRFEPLNTCQTVTVGQPQPNDKILAADDDALISATHTAVTDNGEAFCLEDLDSDNGTWLRIRSVSLPHARWLRDGISFRVGRHLLTIRSTYVWQSMPAEPELVPDPIVEVPDASAEELVPIMFGPSPAASNQPAPEMPASTAVVVRTDTDRDATTARESLCL